MVKMNLETFWKIINKANVLEVQDTGEAIKDAVMELKKYSEKEIKTFALIFYEYYNLLFAKYKINELDCLSDEYFELYYLPTFILALGYPAYRYFYQLRLTNAKKLNQLLDILYGKMMFDGKEHPGAVYGFPELEEIATYAYEEKFEKELIPDFDLDEKQTQEILHSLEKYPI